MENERWSRDVLLGNRKDELTEEQRIRYELIQNVDHIINRAVADVREISTGRCNPLQYSEFIKRVYRAYLNTAREMRECGGNGEALPLFDALVRLADFAYPAIKNISNSPSRALKKVEVKMPAYRATGLGNKSMRWLSERPGLSFAEKVSPENKVLTTKTVFTVDTKENREFMYLYKRLHEIVGVRLVNTACAECQNYGKCGREWVARIKNLNSTYSRLKTSELSEVKGEKQAVQNNKLMCDLNYKIVWDAVKELSHVEENTKKVNGKLFERTACLIYWILLGKIMADNRAALVDCLGFVTDVYQDEKCVVLNFYDEETEEPHTKDVVVFKNEHDKYIETLYLSLDGTRISIVDSKNVSVYDLDVYDSLNEERL